MIRGSFDPTRSGPYPWVGAAVYLPGYSQGWFVVRFLLDTGAATTCLHPRDAISRGGIDAATLADPQFWPSASPRQGVGGTSDYYTIDAHYAFVHSDTGRIQTIAGTIDVAAITASNQQLPSLLGWDILQNFVLAVDSRSGTVTLS
jgi:hypothetical protein